MKRRKNLLLILPLLLVLFGCDNKRAEGAKDNLESFVMPIERSYDEVGSFAITWEHIFDVDSEEYFVYFYSLTCSHCSELKNFIIEEALSRGNIYFSKASSKDIILTDTKSSIGAGKSGDISILGYPTMIKIYHHICTENVSGKTKILNLLK